MANILASGLNPTATHANGTCTFKFNGTAWELHSQNPASGRTCSGVSDLGKVSGSADDNWIVITETLPNVLALGEGAATATHASGTCTFAWNGKSWELVEDNSGPGRTCFGQDRGLPVDGVQKPQPGCRAVTETGEPPAVGGRFTVDESPAD